MAHPSAADPQTAPALAGPFTLRELVVMAGGVLMLVGSVVPFEVGAGSYANVWNFRTTAFNQIITLALPILLSGAFAWRRLNSRHRIVIGTLTLDQLTSVIAVLTTIYFFISAVMSMNAAFLLGLIGALAMLASSTLARYVPGFAQDFEPGQAPLLTRSIRPSAPAKPSSRKAQATDAQAAKAQEPRSRETARMAGNAAPTGHSTAPANAASPGTAAAAPTGAESTSGKAAASATSAESTSGMTAAGPATSASATGPASASAARTTDAAAVPGTPSSGSSGATAMAQPSAAAGSPGAASGPTQDRGTTPAGASDASTTEQPGSAGAEGRQERIPGGTQSADTASDARGDRAPAGDAGASTTVVPTITTTADTAADTARDAGTGTGTPGAAGADVQTRVHAQQDGGDQAAGSAPAPQDEHRASAPATSAEANEEEESASFTASRAEESENASRAFWFAVPHTRPAVDEATGAHAFTLEPGAWILALEDRGEEFVVQDTDGRIGVLRDLRNVERA